MSEKRTRDRSLLLGAQLRIGEPRAIKQVLDAYRKTRGDEQAAAVLLDIPRRTLINWRERVPALDEGLREIREQEALWEEAKKAAKK